MDSPVAGVAGSVALYVAGAIGWEGHLSGRALLKQAPWLLAAAAIVGTGITVGAGFGFQLVLVGIVAAYCTGADYTALRDERHGVRWLARYAMWVGFLAAPCFLAAAFINE